MKSCAMTAGEQSKAQNPLLTEWLLQNQQLLSFNELPTFPNVSSPTRINADGRGTTALLNSPVFTLPPIPSGNNKKDKSENNDLLTLDPKCLQILLEHYNSPQLNLNNARYQNVGNVGPLDLSCSYGGLIQRMESKQLETSFTRDHRQDLQCQKHSLPVLLPPSSLLSHQPPTLSPQTLLLNHLNQKEETKTIPSAANINYSESNRSVELLTELKSLVARLRQVSALSTAPLLPPPTTNPSSLAPLDPLSLYRLLLLQHPTLASSLSSKINRDHGGHTLTTYAKNNTICRYSNPPSYSTPCPLPPIAPSYLPLSKEKIKTVSIPPVFSNVESKRKAQTQTLKMTQTETLFQKQNKQQISVIGKWPKKKLVPRPFSPSFCCPSSLSPSTFTPSRRKPLSTVPFTSSSLSAASSSTSSPSSILVRHQLRAMLKNRC